MIDKSDLLVSKDSNSLYPSTMAHVDLKWPKTETAEASIVEEGDGLCSLFNNGGWKSLNKSGIFKLRFYSPKENIFQHMKVTENIINDRKKRHEQINRVGNGDITQHFTSVNFDGY